MPNLKLHSIDFDRLFEKEHMKINYMCNNCETKSSVEFFGWHTPGGLWCGKCGIYETWEGVTDDWAGSLTPPGPYTPGILKEKKDAGQVP